MIGEVVFEALLDVPSAVSDIVFVERRREKDIGMEHGSGILTIKKSFPVITEKDLNGRVGDKGFEPLTPSV